MEQIINSGVHILHVVILIVRLYDIIDGDEIKR